MNKSKFQQLVFGQLDAIMDSAGKSLGNTKEMKRMAELLRIELTATQKQLDETRSHLFTMLAEQNHPFKFKPGQTVDIYHPTEFQDRGWVVSERWHQKDGDGLSKCTNIYRLYRADSDVVLEEEESGLFESPSPNAPAKRKHTKKAAHHAK